MKNILLFIMSGYMAVNLCSCGSHAESISAFHNQEIECLGVELDGSQTLRVFGTGKNKSDAVEQAKKNAVRAVVFKGITAGRAGCNMRPLVNEANAEEKYEDYFNIFFMDKGEYRKYVSMKDECPFSKSKNKTAVDVSYVVTVRILRSELKARLTEDNILVR